jgi:hypothetical protein
MSDAMMGAAMKTTKIMIHGDAKSQATRLLPRLARGLRGAECAARAGEVTTTGA